MNRQLAGGEILGVTESRTGDQSSGVTGGETGNHRNGRAMAILVASLPTLPSTLTTPTHHHRAGAVVGVVRTEGENQDGDKTGTTAAVLGMATVGVTGVGGIEDTRHSRRVVIQI